MINYQYPSYTWNVHASFGCIGRMAAMSSSRMVRPVTSSSSRTRRDDRWRWEWSGVQLRREEQGEDEEHDDGQANRRVPAAASGKVAVPLAT